jgi:hypothetical protein
VTSQALPPVQVIGTVAVVPLTATLPALATPADGVGVGVGAGVCGLAANVAVTFRSELSVTVHGPVPEQPPPAQPVKDEPDAGVAVSVTLEPTP